MTLTMKSRSGVTFLEDVAVAGVVRIPVRAADGKRLWDEWTITVRVARDTEPPEDGPDTPHIVEAPK